MGISKMGLKYERRDISCWEYFQCPRDIRDTCLVYLHNQRKSPFCEGWFIFKNKTGGPAGRGPCYSCEMVKKFYPEIESMITNSF